MGGEGLNLHYGDDWGLKFPQRSKAGIGVPGNWPSLSEGVPGSGRSRPPPHTHTHTLRLTSSHLMNLLPRRRVSPTVGGSSCSAWTPGLAPAMAGMGAGRRPSGPPGGPTALLLLPHAPARPAPAPRRQRPPARQSVPDRPENRRGPGGAGRGRNRSGAAPSHRVGPARSRRLPLAAGAATAARVGDWGKGVPEPGHFAGGSAGRARGEERTLGARGAIVGVKRAAEDRLGSAR